jgi:hypothetical protein
MLLLANIVLLASPALAQESGFEKSSLVIVKIPNLTGEQYAQITTALFPSTRYSLEYSCLISGVIALRYYHNFTEEADVRTAIRATLRRYAPPEQVDVIYVDISSESDTQC